MRLQRIAVWGFLFAGVLGIITGLRDTFAPGFLNVSPQLKGTSDIILQFVSAAGFFAFAYLLRIPPQVKADNQR